MFAALLLPVAIMAQVVTTEPAFITSNYRGKIVVTFNPNEGNKGMVGATSCYAHTGVITAESTSDSDWKYAPEWRGGEAKYKMTKVGSNWQLVIDDMYSYYECPTTETIEKLAFSSMTVLQEQKKEKPLMEAISLYRFMMKVCKSSLSSLTVPS